ncbi:MAG TPA: hypothetical protein VF026_07110 [Ktedonobacteraceae bacterium]
MPVPPYMPRPNPEDENEAQAEEYVEDVNELPPPSEEVPPSDVPEAAATEPEIVLPTMAQYETNGGPLGCCMGIVVGVLISLLLGIIGFGRVTANIIVFLVHVDPATNIRIATALFTVIGTVLGGYIGWKVGKRLYREYELSPKRQQKLERLEKRHLQRLQRKR